MRKLIALAVIALACIGGGGALASTASAANCTPNTGSTRNVAGAVKTAAALGNCQAVSRVRFVQQGSYTPPAWSWSGWWDNSVMYQVGAYLCGIGCMGDQEFAVNLNGGSAQVNMIQPCWYSGTHVLYDTFLFQIKNANYPFQWGPIHQFIQSYSVPVAC